MIKISLGPDGTETREGEISTQGRGPLLVG